jgi:hypothetical protein
MVGKQFSSSWQLLLVAMLMVGCSTLFAAQPANGVGAPADGVNDAPPVLNAPTLPVPAGSNLTPQQMQSIMQYRYLQSRGRGQVRTGYPQFVPFGQPGMGMFPDGGGMAAPEEEPATTRKSSTQKRIEAKKAAEEKKRATRDAQKAKAKKKKAKDPDANS